MRVLVLLSLLAGSLACSSFAEAAEVGQKLPSIQELAKLSDFDLGQTYLTAKQLLRNDGSSLVGRFIAEAKGEIQKRGSTQIEAVYDGSVSSACPRDSFVSGFAQIEQDGVELKIIHDSRILPGVIVKDTVLVVIPPKLELLVGQAYEGGIALVARRGDCSMSFARAVDLPDAVRAGNRAAVQLAIDNRRGG